MRFHKDQLLIYAVTDRAWTGGRSLCGQVEEALKGGATMVQFREKSLEKKNFDQILGEAKALRELTQRYHVPLIIDDNMDLAEACNADGLHVGQDDMPAWKVREILGEDKIIGVSAQTVEQAIKAEKDGADYLGVGAVFPTSSKADAVEVEHATLRDICVAVQIPAVAIGGISAENVSQLAGTGIDGIAVISAIFAQDFPKLAAEELKKKVEAIQ